MKKIIGAALLAVSVSLATVLIVVGIVSYRASAAVTNTAAFAQSAFFAQGKVTAAKAAIGTATTTNAVAVIATGGVGVNGAIITGINAIPTNSVTASWVCVYWSTDSGTTITPFACGTLASYTAAATLAPTPLNLTHMDGSIVSPTNPIYIPYSATTAIYAAAGVAVADGIIVTINGNNL